MKQGHAHILLGVITVCLQRNNCIRNETEHGLCRLWNRQEKSAPFNNIIPHAGVLYFVSVSEKSCVSFRIPLAVHWHCSRRIRRTLKARSHQSSVLFLKKGIINVQLLLLDRVALLLTLENGSQTHSNCHRQRRRCRWRSVWTQPNRAIVAAIACNQRKIGFVFYQSYQHSDETIVKPVYKQPVSTVFVLFPPPRPDQVPWGEFHSKLTEFL